jgi:DNA-binding MltR family transcriptional regulator
LIYPTATQLITRVRQEIDATGEDDAFPDTEIYAAINEAIKVASSEILTINEDYFRTEGAISLVNGQSLYDLPANIYAQKIRSIVYAVGSIIYPVKKLKYKDKFLNKQFIKQFNIGNVYCYDLKNDTAVSGVKLELLPTSRETTSNALVIDYIRNANKLAAGADLCDIPEFEDFIVSYAKAKLLSGEGNPLGDGETELAAMLKKLMVDTLSNRVPDDEDEIELDPSYYEEHS